MMNLSGVVVDSSSSSSLSHSPLSPSTAAELAIANRKFAKTCVEKKRRDRINKCLDELKEIMSQTDDKARYQKMEKAEILEMAVNYMRMSMSAGGKLNAVPPSNDVYAIAYNQLLADFTHSLACMPGLRDDFKAQVLSQMSAQILRNKMAVAAAQVAASAALQQQQQNTTSSGQQDVPPPPPTQQQKSSSNISSANSVPSAPKRRRTNEQITSNNVNKKFCVDTSSSAQQYYMYTNTSNGKYHGGSSSSSSSCSSVDTMNSMHVPVSPCGSSASSMCGGGVSDGQALNLSSSSSHSSSSSSPPVSACSSPNSSSSLSSSSSKSAAECFNKIFRPYL